MRSVWGMGCVVCWCGQGGSWGCFQILGEFEFVVMGHS